MSLNLPKTPIVLLLMMVAAAGITVAATPTKKMVENGPRFDLEKVIPESFGDWKRDQLVTPIVVAPDVQAKLDRIYDQTLARTYVNSAGSRIMLSIAYGGDQSDAMQVHRPEVCYAAQGFQVVRASIGSLLTDFGTLPVKRLFAVMGRRQEPITYWITVGDRATYAGFQQKLLQLRYGLTGKIPDGLLVRVSSIDSNEPNAYTLHAEFLRSMLGAMTESDRIRITGHLDA